MNYYLSYVVQDAKEHTHHSKVIDINKGPQYIYSTDTQVSEIFKWAENKQSELLPDQELIILNMYKL